MIHRRIGRVAIYDTDASGLIFYGAPARWFADAEAELYPLLGLDFSMMRPDEPAAPDEPVSPTRAFSVSIDVAMRYHQTFVHEVWLARVGTTSLTFEHRITRDHVICVRGEVHRVFVKVDSSGTLQAVPVPDFLRQHVSSGPA